MDNVIDRSESGKETSDQRTAPARRPWHAPQFMLTEVAGTDSQSATVGDYPASLS